MEMQENVNSCNGYIHPDSNLHHRLPINSKVELKEIYQECLSDVGEFKDFECHINIDNNVRPLMHAPYMIALLLQKKLEKKLEEMVKQGIIAPVEVLCKAVLLICTILLEFSRGTVSHILLFVIGAL